MRIACLQVWFKSFWTLALTVALTSEQFAPQVGDVDNNLNRADAVLSKANPQNLDILVLPELAFSGMSKLCRAQWPILIISDLGNALSL